MSIASRLRSTAIGWEEAVQLVRTGSYAQLARSAEQDREYRAHMAAELPRFASLKDYIFHVKFGCPFLDDGSKRVMHPLALIEQQRAAGLPVLRLPKLMANSFPYHFAADVAHYVLWDVCAPPTDAALDVVILTRLADVLHSPPVLGENYIYWVNPEAEKSIPDVWHAHVLARRWPADADDHVATSTT